MAVELDVRQPVFLQPGGGEVVNDEEATSVVIKADLVEIAVTRRLVDVFYVLEGTLTMRIADAAVEARPGAFACVPPGVVHTFSNGSDLPVRFLNVNTPAGWENDMRELAKAFREGRMPTADEIGRIASRYDFQPVT